MTLFIVCLAAGAVTAIGLPPLQQLAEKWAQRPPKDRGRHA